MPSSKCNQRFVEWEESHPVGKIDRLALWRAAYTQAVRDCAEAVQWDAFSAAAGCCRRNLNAAADALGALLPEDSDAG